jgi:Copper type II ascorbate-dependent monooxygenase, C-terminal domain/Copper type II ascorbate-dependent monooxygenase, N-terminal domain/Cytochrome C oxidase, cbb3-type, subunit III
MRSRWLGCLLVLAACGDSADEPVVPVGPGSYDSGVAPVVPGTTAGTVTPGTTAGLATPGGTISGGVIAGTSGTTAGTMVGGATAGAGSLPCDVQKLLKDKCQTCHGEPLMGAAPMPLITLADFSATSKIVAGQKISARVKARINDTKMPMPPAGRDALTAAEKTALTAFIDGGLKPATAACTTSPTGGTTAGTTPAGTGGIGGLGSDWQPADSDCDVLMELRAHGSQSEGDTSPFMAPTGGDHYEIFWYRPTWNEKMHVIRIDPLIDNNAVLHHWLLYQKPSGAEAAGSHAPDSGLQSSDSALLSGWAPGNKNIPLGTEVGLQTIQGSGSRFGIEIHYNTGSNPPNRADRSGARICATKKLRKHEAATHWLGTQAIIGTSATGTCSVPMESHIIAHSPHMHKTGKYMKTIVTKKSGGTVTITDKPFDFNDQQIFPVPGGEIVVQAGDVITTTCDYTAFATFGTGTADEMCYNFVIAYPVGSLQSTSLLTVGGTKTTCIDGF